MKRTHKLLSLILTICIVMSMLTGFTPADTVSETKAIADEIFELPDIVDSEEAKENNYVGRVEAEEKDLYTFVFANGDGTNTMRIYSHPVKYVAEDGSVRDIALGIEAKSGGGFATADHEIVTTFEGKLTEGISLEYNDTKIMLLPELGLGTEPTAELSNDGKAVTYEMDNVTSFVYKLTYAGFKEDIVVEEYTGQTEYEFTLFTNGLTLCEEYGSYYLADAEGNIKATIGDIIVFTADERNNTMGSMTYETVRANQEYVLTIHLDAEYLVDDDTTYPIRIDPTIEINYDKNGAGAIEDVTITQNTTFGGTSGSLYVGRHPTGALSRALMRFPKLSLSGISANQITAATVELRDLMCQGNEDITVECHIYNNSAPSWSESGTTTWSGVGSSYLGSLLDSHLISYGKGNVGNHRYSFNILSAAKAWANGTQSPAKGLVFKANSTFENQTGTAVKTWYKTFAAYNRSDYRPSLSISYTFSADAETISTDVLTNITISSAGATKIFKFAPASTGFYTFESSNIISGDPKAWLYNSDFDELSVNDDANTRNFRLTYHLVSGFTYYFAAGSYGSGTGSYSVKLTKTTNSSYINAITIKWGDSKTASCSSKHSVSFYKFTPTATGEYLLYTSNASGDPKIWLYNSSMNLVTSSDDGAGNYNSRLVKTLTAGQTYYVVGGHYGVNSGAYKINLLLSANIANGIHLLKNVGTSKYMDIDGPAAQEWVRQWTFHTSLQERWRFQKQSNGSYTIRSEYGEKKYVGVENGTVGSDSIKLYTSVSNNTKWNIYTNPSGELFLEPVGYLGKILYAPNGLTGTELQLEWLSYSSSSRHKWHFEVLSDTPAEGQQMSNWCWVTAARMFAKHYYNTVSRTQSQAVIDVKGRLVNEGGWENEGRDAALFYTDNVATQQLNLRYCISDGSSSCRIFSEATLRKFLDDGHVVYITRSWYGNNNERTGGHAYVISGYTSSYENGEIKYQYIILNPWPSGDPQPGTTSPVVTSGERLTRSYQWICNGRTVAIAEGQDDGIWEGYVVVNTSYSTNTILPVYNR